MNTDERPDFTRVNQRDRMLSAMRTLLFRDKKDYNSITIMDICKKANVSRRTFYRYFNNKYECIYEMGVHDLNGFEKLIADIINNKVNPVEKLKLLMNQLLKTFYEDFTKSIIDELKSETPEFWEMNLKRFKEIASMVARIIEEGVKDGSFKKDTDPSMVVYLLCCATDSEMNQRFMSEEKYSQPVIIEKTFDILFNGILSNEAQPKQ